jgi:hypothetical protein
MPTNPKILIPRKLLMKLLSRPIRAMPSRACKHFLPILKGDILK